MTLPASDFPNNHERVTVTNAPKKKLIETSLPLEAINAESGREKSIRHGHPSTMHLWWSRKPLATARAVLFAQLVDDPSAHPEEFPTTQLQDQERRRLHSLIERLIIWENSNDQDLLEQARAEIRKSNAGSLPRLLDPFSGGGSIPLEAQRLGLEAHASDLNPVAVLLNRALIEIPPRFSGYSPVSKSAESRTTGWSAAEGLAEDVLRYGTWVRDEAFKRIGKHYPKVQSEGGTEHTVLAWKWARTVPSPNPANPVEIPLVNSWWLNKKKGKEAWIQPVVTNGTVQYKVRCDPHGPEKSVDGTINRQGGRAVGDQTPFTFKYVRERGRAGEMGAHLIAVVAEGKPGRLYFSPTQQQLLAADVNRPNDLPSGEIPFNPQYLLPPNYGFSHWSDLYTDRQALAMNTFSDLVLESWEKIRNDALASGVLSGPRLNNGGQGAEAYADAVVTYLALAVSRQADRLSSLASWQSIGEKVRNVFARQAVPMVWDFAEVNPFSSSSGNFLSNVEWVQKALASLPANALGFVTQGDASTQNYVGAAISTDPPYYDYIGYADLSDYFYIWLRKMLEQIHPDIAGTLETPKVKELMANKYRQGSKEQAREHFVDGFNQVFSLARSQAASSIPMTIYYAYKQQDATTDENSPNGWHTLLSGLIASGWEITATWPVRSERAGRIHSVQKNTLASSIVLACRMRSESAPASTRRSFVAQLKAELPDSLRTLMQGTIAPVDLAQAAIGPGISVFSRFSRVREADGSDMSVRAALILINSTLDEVLGEQESDFDSDTRFAIKWYRQYGWNQENSGIADQLARSSDTSIGALERGGIFEAKGGKARLFSPSQLENEWDVAADERVSVWEATVRLAAVMAKDGADKVAELLSTVQTRVSLDAVKELGFLLFHEAEKKKDTKDAILFNGLVSAWGDVNEHARKFASTPRYENPGLDLYGEDY